MRRRTAPGGRTPRAAAARDPRAQGAARRGAAVRWAIGGAALGAAAALVAFAPAEWLARRVAAATGQRLLLADARGTVWSGSAVPVLTGGPASRDAAALPGRIAWEVGWHGSALELRASDDCCLQGPLTLRVQPGWARVRVTLVPGGAPLVGRWPAAWLSGLGAPWNTLEPGGTLALASPGLALEWVAGRLRLDGRLALELLDASSRLSPLPVLGSYRATLAGDAAGVAPRIELTTLSGALQLSASGTLGANGLRLRGEAGAAPGDEAALANLLNIVGRRSGARSLISIG